MEPRPDDGLRRLPCGALDLDVYLDRGRRARGRAFARAFRRLAGRFAIRRTGSNPRRLAAARS